MRKTILALLGFSLAVIYYNTGPTIIAAAVIEEYCRESEIKFKDSDVEEYWKYSAAKTFPNFVLDYYQDPKMTGVDITIAIEAAELVATYWKWEDVCLPIDDPYNMVNSNCTPAGGSTPGIKYRWQPQCVPQPTETTYRTIDTSSVSVWLDMTVDSRKLLGPGPYFKGASNPVLRYLYPDQWAVKVVRPGEMKIIEKSGFKTADEVKSFL